MIITQTPLRISIAGGGTDLPDYYRARGGYVVSTAIDKYVFVIVKERYDDKIYVDYSKKEIVDSIDEIQHDLVREAARLSGMTHGFEIAMMADIPSEGSGLGSSSSLTVGLLNAFYQFRGEQVTPERLAREACEIEIDILGKPIGKQDQYIAAFGGLCAFSFNDDDTVDVERLSLPPSAGRRLGSNLLLFFTNIVRQAGSVLAEQRERILVDTIGYHDEIKALAVEVRELLMEQNFDAVGEVLGRSWAIKKGLANGISNETIDSMYDAAMTGGALGGKISGAGGGGFLMVYCRRPEQDSLRAQLGGYREMPFMLDPHGSKVIFNQQRYSWK
ncbi:MAG TPA: GHMP kinase [Candidatus Kapabacteria bacterium]|jgi:D-glycero-alpha-D-manno-heptose-7-phosphate kinase|nr:GHMP kinase [Candidatus Kapabacteria bacterium]